MTDEQDSSNNEYETPPESPKVESIEPVPSPESKPATEADLQEVEKQMNGFERSTLRWTRASFVIVLATAIFIGLQWLEMRSGGTDTHDLAVQAKRQADKMKDMSDAADKIRQAAEGMVSQEKRLADKTEEALSASNKQSRDSLNASIAASRLDQRAWLTVRAVKLNKPPAMNEKLQATVEFINSGKIPAIDVVVNSTVITREDKSNDIFGPTTGTPPSRAVIGPNVPMLSLAESSEAFSRQGQLDVLKTTHFIYVVGAVFYNDVFRSRHKTSFCFRLSPDQLANGTMLFSACEVGNKTQDYKKGKCPN